MQHTALHRQRKKTDKVIVKTDSDPLRMTMRRSLRANAEPHRTSLFKPRKTSFSSEKVTKLITKQYFPHENKKIYTQCWSFMKISNSFEKFFVKLTSDWRFKSLQFVILIASSHPFIPMYGGFECVTTLNFTFRHKTDVSRTSRTELRNWKPRTQNIGAFGLIEFLITSFAFCVKKKLEFSSLNSF